MEQLNQSQNLEPIPRLRAEHVVNEINRVQQFVTALSEGNLSAAGHLMMDSHTSLRDLFEASCPELDHLVEIGTEPDGVWGGRMTGGGFGGCVLCAIDTSNFAVAREDVLSGAEELLGTRPWHHQVQSCGRVEQLAL